MQALQDELRAQRDLNQLLQDDFASAHRQDGGTGIPTLSSADGDVRSVTPTSCNICCFYVDCKIKSSLYSRYYAEACNEWWGTSPRLSETQI